MGSSNSKAKSAEKRMSGAALAEKRRKALEKHGGKQAVISEQQSSIGAQP